MRLPLPTAHRQPTEAQRAAQREAALDRQRATAASAQTAAPDAAAAFPAKDPAKQRPLLEGQRMVDIRMYEQVAASRNRMAQQLSAANRHVTFLETVLESRRGEVAAAMDSMRTLTQDLAKLEGLVTSVSAAALHGLDRADTQRKFDLMLQRIKSMTKTAVASRSALDRLVAREVPVSWFGLASQVKLMGDFDGWSRGIDLSAEETTGDSVFTRFTATLLLPKGEYQVKFQVDGEWRLAPDWPQVETADRSQNNVLVIE